VRRTLALVVGCALVAAACEGGSVAAPRPTLDVVMADDWESAPIVRQVIRDFEREHEVRVQVQATPFSQIPDLVRNAIDLGDPFDLAHWHAFAAAADDLAEPLDEQWEAAGLEPDEFLPGAVDDVTWDGRRYGVPLDVNALVLLVNGAVLREAGLGPEALADAGDFLEIARTLQEEGGVDHAITLTASSWAAYGWIRAYGGHLLTRDDDGTVTFTFDDPRTVEAIDALGTLASEGVGTPPFAPDLSLDAVQSLITGAVAMHPTGSWDLPITRRAAGAAVPAEDVLVLPMPRGEGDTGTVLGGSSLFVPRGAEHPDLAFAFAQALTDLDVGVDLAREEGRLPARVAAYDDATFQDEPQYAAFVAELPEADVMPLIAYPDLSAAFGAAIERVLKGQQPAAEAFEELQDLAERTTTP
jgi:multiple sugar transport system substrate-binding protein